MSMPTVRFIALVAAAGVALAGFSSAAEAAKKKRRHTRPQTYSRSYQPTPSEYNYCVRQQLRYPQLDIRC